MSISHLSKATYSQICIWEFHNKHLLENILENEERWKCTIQAGFTNWMIKAMPDRMFYMQMSTSYDYLLPIGRYPAWDPPACTYSQIIASNILMALL